MCAVWQWDGTKWINISSVPNPVVPAFTDVGRNLIHNPLFIVTQRGTGPWTVTGYTTDRWMLAISGSSASVSVLAVSDGSRTAIGDEAASSQLSTVVTGTAGAGDYVQLLHRIEDIRRLAGKTVTVSFWAIASAGTPRIGVSFQQFFGAGGSSPVQGAGQSVQISTTWARYSLTFNIASIIGLTVGAGNLTQMQIFLSAESSFSAASGGVGVQSATFTFWGVQLEVGSVATPLDYGGSPQQQLAECQRFYQTGYWFNNTYASAAAGTWQVMASLPVTMHHTPTVAIAGTTYTNASGATVNPWDATHFVVQLIATAVGPLICYGQYTASADL